MGSAHVFYFADANIKTNFIRKWFRMSSGKGGVPVFPDGLKALHFYHSGHLSGAAIIVHLKLSC
jgi:hypothetical protein